MRFGVYFLEADVQTLIALRAFCVGMYVLSDVSRARWRVAGATRRIPRCPLRSVAMNPSTRETVRTSARTISLTSMVSSARLWGLSQHHAQAGPELARCEVVFSEQG
ncbi:hypothetical protein [Streptomyces cucumeris]|uniref:hypothetical protein n=1 Tax=Streptomyces cucumeris TaxID=2962890 RepID=UPI0020C8A2A3|nr:hypothetical protein [Streptomyces sp. NEAU-Y11]MCP9211485.1 hypothetical protein [Streptomyces sp. NEAU-Y11]